MVSSHASLLPPPCTLPCYCALGRRRYDAAAVAPPAVCHHVAAVRHHVAAVCRHVAAVCRHVSPLGVATCHRCVATCHRHVSPRVIATCHHVSPPPGRLDCHHPGNCFYTPSIKAYGLDSHHPGICFYTPPAPSNTVKPLPASESSPDPNGWCTCRRPKSAMYVVCLLCVFFLCWDCGTPVAGG